MPKKCVLVLLDGIGDRSYEIFDDKTPLQAAQTPVLDHLAKNSSNGLYHASIPGHALPSESAHFAIFGYQMADFPGRGPLEALGAGIKLTMKDVAILSHFVTLDTSDKHGLVKKDKPEISHLEYDLLCKEIIKFKKDNINIRFHPTGGIRGIVTLTGNVSPYITDSDPFIDGRPLVKIKPWAKYESDKASFNTASALNAYLIYVKEKLENHPLNQDRLKNGRPLINGLVTQRSGRLKKVTPFNEKFGFNGLSLASGLVYQGLSKYINMDFIQVNDSVNPGLDMAQRLKLTRDKLELYDFIHVHTKAPDEAAHTKDPVAKKKVIEMLDKGIGKVVDHFIKDPDLLLVITSDHSTPSSGPLIHSGENVPLMIHGQGVRRDQVTRFDEINAAGGLLGSVRGHELMYQILNHLDRVKLQGIMDTPYNQDYWPGNYEEFKM